CGQSPRHAHAVLGWRGSLKWIHRVPRPVSWELPRDVRWWRERPFYPSIARVGGMGQVWHRQTFWSREAANLAAGGHWGKAGCRLLPSRTLVPIYKGRRPLRDATISMLRIIWPG